MTSPHIINKVSLEMNTGSLGDVSSLQEDMSRLLWQQAFPQMEQLFDQLILTDEVVRLDRVVIDLPRFDPHYATADFVPQLMEVLERHLREYLAGNHPVEIQHAYSSLTQSDDERVLYSQTRSDGESFLYFLQYGRLPWWSSRAPWPNWLTRWQSALPTENSWQEPLRSLLATQPNVVHRLVSQFPKPFQHQLLLHLQPTWIEGRSLLHQTQRLIAVLNVNDAARAQLTRSAWSILFTQVGQVSTYSPLPQARWIRQWMEQLIALLQSAPSLHAWRQQFRSAESDSSLSQALPNPVLKRFLEARITEAVSDHLPPWQQVLAQVLPAAATSEQTVTNEEISGPHDPLDRLHQSDHPVAPADLDGADPENAQPSDSEAFNREQLIRLYFSDEVREKTSESDLSKPTQASPLAPDETTSGLPIGQAGVVLLHPFLRPYFEDVGLLQGDRFQTTDCQQTAIYLLYYLATRQTDPPEYELVLPKLLCGWPLNEAVIPPDLPQTALDEAEHLLQTVINYWEVLKSTSPDGLREGFLQREGKLTRSDESRWKLQVEQQAIDILLSRLPWGVSMVRLPWMDGLLIVEWT